MCLWQLCPQLLYHRAWKRRRGRCRGGVERSFGGDGGESNSPSRTLRQGPLRACPMLCRQPAGLPSAGSPAVQSRVPRSGLTSGYAAVTGVASSLNDASTAREDEAASTLTLAAYAARARAGWRLPVTSFCHVIYEAQWRPRLAFPDNQALSNPHIPRADVRRRPHSLPERLFDGNPYSASTSIQTTTASPDWRGPWSNRPAESIGTPSRSAAARLWSSMKTPTARE